MSSPLPASRMPSGASGSTDERFGLLMSIQPQFATAILDGTKTVELRRKPPRNHPDIVIIYGSGTAKAILGMARLNAIHTSTPADIWKKFGTASGLTRAEFDEYFSGSGTASAIELIDARRSSAQVPLKRLREVGLEPPQSWRYVERQTAIHLLDALGFTAPPHSPVRPAHRSVPLPALATQFGQRLVARNRPLLQLVDNVRCLGGIGAGEHASAAEDKAPLRDPG